MDRVKRALVLAGGGIAGIAWEIGILRGIADERPEVVAALRNSPVVLGTSAGSAVGAQLASDLTLAELFDRQVEGTSAEIRPGVDIDTVGRLFLDAVGDSNKADAVGDGNKADAVGDGDGEGAMLAPNITKAEKLQRIGAVALATDTVDSATRRAVIEQRLPAHDWPEHELRITAIDIDSGELVVFDRDGGVALVDAVTASCAVPGAWPVVTIDGRRYMDGGIGSSVNLVAAVDCSAAVVLVPGAADAPSLFGAGTAAEVDSFPGAVFALYADEPSRVAFGRDPLDPACRIPSAQAGRRQGRAAAASIADFLAHIQ